MTTTIHHSFASATQLSDRDLLEATARAAAEERRATTQLITLLAEVDSRKLYLGEGYSSLFTYCRYRLRLSEFAAYSRIEAARVARRFPIALVRLAEGALTLTTIGLLAPHLTEETHEALFDAAQFASRREVERLIASLFRPPDIPASVRRLPESDEPRTAVPVLAGPSADAREDDLLVSAAPATADVSAPAALATPPATPRPTSPDRRDVVAPLAVGRYLLRVTIAEETHARLDKARDLLRHVVPNGDLAQILDRALEVLVDQLERQKTGRVSRPRRSQTASSSHKRHIPAAVKREVWARDEGRCAFVGTDGRCAETGFLEYHHVVAYAKGGLAEVANIQLRCRAHNAHEARQEFGDGAT